MLNLLQNRLLSLCGAVMLLLNSFTVYAETPAVETGKEAARLLHSLKRSGDYRTEIAWSPDGTRILSSSWDMQHVSQRRRAGGRWAFEPATITIHDVKSGKALRVIKLGGLLSETRGSGPTCLAWSPDGLMFATGHKEGYREDTVRIWDAKTGKEIITFKGQNVERVSWSPDGKKLASSGYDEVGRRLPDLSNRTIRIWDPAGVDEPITIQGSMGSQSWSPDGTRMAIYAKGGGLTLWDALAWKEFYSLDGQSNIAWSPSGSKLATRSGVAQGLGDIVSVWDAASGQNIHRLKVPGYSMNIAWSPDGSRLASCGGKKKDKVEEHYGFEPSFFEGLLVIWDANSGRQLHRIEGHKYSVSDLAWSPDGTRLASCDGLDREIFQTGPNPPPIVIPPEANLVKIWDALSGKELHRIQGHAARVFDVSWSPDGTKLLSTDSVDISKIWSIPK